MIRLDLVLLAVVVLCALGTVAAQHRARNLFVELQKEQVNARMLDEEWGQLQLEQSTWAMHSRIESVATSRLRMRVPPTERIQMIPASPPVGAP
jgi:cell division protein FtsL